MSRFVHKADSDDRFSGIDLSTRSALDAEGMGMVGLIVLVLVATVGVFFVGIAAGSRLTRGSTEITESEHDPY